MIDTLQIPDALLDWGRQDSVAVRWPRPWAHEVDQILTRPRPLSGDDLDSLMNHLEALADAAMAEGHHELLLGFDLLTAEWLNLRYTFTRPDGSTVAVGPGGEWSYAELRVLLAASGGPQEPREPSGGSAGPSWALQAATEAKAAVCEAFPGVEVGAIAFPEGGPASTCVVCGNSDTLAMLTTESGNDYCWKCWSSLTDSTPALKKAAKR